MDTLYPICSLFATGIVVGIGFFFVSHRIIVKK